MCLFQVSEILIRIWSKQLGKIIKLISNWKIILCVIPAEKYFLKARIPIFQFVGSGHKEQRRVHGKNESELDLNEKETEKGVSVSEPGQLYDRFAAKLPHEVPPMGIDSVGTYKDLPGNILRGFSKGKIS